MKKQLWFPGKNILATSSGSQQPLLLLLLPLLQTKKPATKTFHSRKSNTHRHAGNPTKPLHKNDDKQCEAFRDSWCQNIYKWWRRFHERGWVYYTTLRIHVSALNPDIIQKLPLREPWQRNSTSLPLPTPPNPCENLAEIYDLSICRSLREPGGC